MRSLIAGLLLVLTLGARAQPAPVVELIQQAEALADKGKYVDALRLMDEKRSICNVAGDTRTCLSLVKYASGYFLQLAAQQSGISTEEIAKFQAAAAEAYALSLQLTPSAEVAFALATLLEDQEKYAEMIPLLRQAAMLDPAGAGLYYNVAGDAAERIHDFDEAERLYRAAILEDPSNEEYRFNLLLLFSGGFEKLDPTARTARLRTFLADARQLQRDGSAFASTAYERIIEHAFRVDDMIALEALCGSLDVAASERTLQGAITAIPQEWRSPALDQIRQVIANPLQVKTLAPWWMAKPLPRHTLASILIALAADAHGLGDPKRAIAILRLVLGDIAPLPGTYTDIPELEHLRGKQVPYFLAAVQLVGIYVEEDDEFMASRLAIGLGWRAVRAVYGNDLSTFQRLQTILAGMKEDLGKRYGRIGAEGHFANAILFSKVRNSRDPSSYQAYPDLHHHLADILATSRNKGRAAEPYLEAAGAYLEVDDLESAQQMLDKYAPFATAKLQATAAGLEQLTRFRRSIDDLPQEHFANGGAELRADPRFRWALGSVKDHPALARQQFKVCADLAKRAMATGAEKEATHLAAAAGIAALTFPAMTGALDTDRLRLVAGVVRNRIMIDSRHAPFQDAPELNDDRFGKVWKYAGGRDSGGFEIGWSRDLVVAVRLLPQVLAASDQIRVALASGVVTLTTGESVSDAAVEALASELGKIVGVSRVDHRRAFTASVTTLRDSH